jgi:tRNA-splicing ligase RtcB (3'-phosphate/5'-hydroxy nucleic acid ligase)
MITIKGKYTNADVMIDDIEENCYKQIIQFVNNIAFTNPIKIMPDCHAGKGSCIGFTMKSSDKISPEIIGVDIGCGMMSVKLPKDTDLSNLKLTNDKIRRNVPMGTSTNKDDKHFKYQMNFKVLTAKMRNAIGYQGEFNEAQFDNMIKKFECNNGRIKSSVGTLGGGNHFIEIGKDEEGNHWLLFILVLEI